MRLLSFLLLPLSLFGDPLTFSVPTPPAIPTQANLLANTVAISVQPTGSMKPTLDERYWVFAASVPFERVHVGDIILFYRGPDLIVHRVVRMSSGGSALITKGDALSEADSMLVTEANYVAMVVAIMRKPDTL